MPTSASGRSTGLLCLAALALAATSTSQAMAQDLAPEGQPPSDGVRLDLQARERIEAYDRAALAIDNQAGAAVAYHRLLAGVAARAGAVGAYVQVGAYGRAGGTGPASPTMVDRLDLQQAYVDLELERGGARLRLRGGRADLGGELAASRDAPNVRRAWDGARATATLGGWTGDAFAVQVVQPRLGVFDDGSRGRDRLLGLHLTSPKRALGRFALSAFAYDVRKARYTVLAGAGTSSTTTVGGVLDGEFGPLDLSIGGARQTGRFGSRRVEAFYVEAEAGHRFGRIGGRPRLGVRFSAFSGGSATARTIRTFDPLFPNFAYSTEAALQSPSNLVKVALLFEGMPSRRLKLECRAEALWRYSARDAYYVPTGFMLVPPDGADERWAGVQHQLRATWRVTPALTLTGALVRFDAGRFLKRQGRGDESFAMTQLALAFR